jgi:predicted HicB family RNase H-like nuclease
MSKQGDRAVKRTARKEVIGLVLRLEPTLHERLTTEAKQSVRSLQGEIIFRLRNSFEQSATAT